MSLDNLSSSDHFSRKDLHKMESDLKPYMDKIQQGKGLSDTEKVKLGSLLGQAKKTTISNLVSSLLSRLTTTRRHNYLTFRAAVFTHLLSESWGKTGQKISTTQAAKRLKTDSFSTTERAKSKESQFQLMQSLFGVGTIRKGGEYPSFLTGQDEAKQTHLTKCIDLDQSTTLYSQSRRYPLMQNAVKAIKDNYSQWDTLQTQLQKEKSSPTRSEKKIHRLETKIEKLKHTIETQHRNLNALSNIVQSLVLSDADASALSQMGIDKKMQNLLSPFISGKKTLKQENAFRLMENLITSLEVIKKDMTTVPGESEQRKIRASLLSKEAIKGQAKLFEAARKGLAFAHKEPDLEALGTSVNKVFPLKESGHTVAYYKEGLAESHEGGIMEKLIWDLAPYTGTVSQITPTKLLGVQPAGARALKIMQTHITEQRNVGSEESKKTTEKHGSSRPGVGPQKQVIEFDEPPEIEFDESEQDIEFEEPEVPIQEQKSQTRVDTELVEASDQVKEMKGSIQADIGGVSLKEYLADPEKQNKMPIDQNKLIDATFATLIYGMFDVHGENVRIDSEGNFKFFDNTRSLPSSNGLINWGGTLISSYRSELLGLPGSFEPLSEEQLKHIQSKIRYSLDHFDEIEKLFESQKKALGELPEGWLNVKDSLQAMKERLINMEKGIAANNVNTLCDLVLASNPGFKYVAVMSLFTDEMLIDKAVPFYDEHFNEFLMTLFTRAGSASMETLIENCSHYGIDPAHIKAICDNPNETINSMMKKIIALRDAVKDGTNEPFEFDAKAKKKLISELLEEAKVDLKDIHPEMISDACKEILIKELDVCGLQLYQHASQKLVNNTLEKTEARGIINQAPAEGDKIYLYSKNSKGELVREEIDYLSNPGKITVGEKVMTVQQYLKSKKLIKG